MAKSASKPVVDPSLLEMDQIAETELQRLQKQVVIWLCVKIRMKTLMKLIYS